jgi:hypothetical protein
MIGGAEIMQRTVCLMIAVLFLATAAFAQQGGGGGPVGLAAAQQQAYNRIKGLVVGSANEMPEAGFAHQPGDTPRTFAQVFAHIADAHYQICAQVRGVANPNQGSLEPKLKTKAETIKELEASYAFCDPAFAALTETSVVEMVTGGRGGPRARGALLSQILEHDNERLHSC